MRIDDSVVPQSLAEGWKQCRDILEIADASDSQAALYKAVFVAGVGVAMAIIYARGFVGLRAEMQREQEGMSDNADAN